MVTATATRKRSWSWEKLSAAITEECKKQGLPVVNGHVVFNGPGFSIDADLLDLRFTLDEAGRANEAAQLRLYHAYQDARVMEDILQTKKYNAGMQLAIIFRYLMKDGTFCLGGFDGIRSDDDLADSVETVEAWLRIVSELAKLTGHARIGRMLDLQAEYAEEII